MNRKSAFRSTGNWYKGNTHAHTSLSDGLFSPSALAAAYRELGYDFLAITDHRIYGVHETLSSADFLILPGVELDVMPSGKESFCHHIVGLGIPGKNSFTDGFRFTYETNTKVDDIIFQLSDNGNICIYAHPAWSHVRHESLLQIDGLFGMEIFNSTCEVHAACGHNDSYYDRMLWEDRHLWCFASDDTHQKLPDMGKGFIMVKSESLTHESILAAITEGSFYASEGPMISDFYLEDGKACLECSDSRLIGFHTDSHPGRAFTDSGSKLTSAEFQLTGTEKYIRASCTDANGRKAWTQPIWTGK